MVFVLDTSGSMMDRKIIQLREAMQTILSDLNPGDYFSIVEFASSVTVRVTYFIYTLILHTFIIKTRRDDAIYVTNSVFLEQ